MVQHARRLKSRVEAVEHLRRTLNNAEGTVALQDRAQEHIADGTLVMGNMSYYAPNVVKFKGDTGRVIIGNFASIAPDADFYVGGLHRVEWVSLYGLRAMLELLPALLAATAGSVTGALILYWIARRGGRRTILATHRVSRVTAADLDRADARFRRHGVWLVLGGRCVPGLRSVISVPAGMAHMHLGLFVALTTLGSSVWNSVLIGAGIALGSQFEEVETVLGPLSTAVVALLAFVVLFVLVKLRRRGRPSA